MISGWLREAAQRAEAVEDVLLADYKLSNWPTTS